MVNQLLVSVRVRNIPNINYVQKFFPFPSIIILEV